MAKKRKGEGNAVEVNMTPMIDCTFQLLIFFLITTKFTNQALAKLQLHEPDVSQAVSSEQVEFPNKTIINVTSKAGEQDEEWRKANPVETSQPDKYVVGGAHIDVGNETELQRLLKASYAAARKAGYKDYFVEIRADKDVSFAAVLPVMEAAANADIPKMNITAIAGDVQVAP
jgi:biopolymer transport protein ExbD